MMCGGGGKKKKNQSHQIYQKVIIPKGMVNPAETTIIEIPLKLQKQPVVVAKRKPSTSQHYDDDESDSGYGRSPPSHCDPACEYRPVTAPALPPPSPPPPQPQYYPSPYPPPPSSHISSPRHGSRGGGTCGPSPVCRQPQQQMYPCPSPSASPRRSGDASNYPSGYSDPSALAETELQELQALKQDLEDFQRARRKLLASTSNLAAKSKAVHSDAGGGGGGGSYPPPYPVPMPMPMPSAHSSLMRPPQQIMMPAQPSGMRMSQQQYMPPQQAYPQSPPQGYGPPPRSPPPRPPPPAQGFEPSMSQGYGGPPSPKITTRISTTKVYKTSPQKPQPRPADHTVKSLNVADKKFDTCGCLDK